MALLQVNFLSEALKKITTFQLLLPNDVQEDRRENNLHYKRETKVLYLLHGFSGNANDWITGSLAQEMSIRYNIAMVMPSGDNSFYLDAKGTGKEYSRFVGEELVQYIRKTFHLSTKKEDTYIGGLSMGGFGAVHVGLKYHDRFEKLFGLSSAFIVNKIKGMKLEDKNDIADYDYYTSIFGDLEKLDTSEKNPEYLIKKLKEEGKQIPDIFMACGTEDFLVEDNRMFYNFLKQQNVKVTYKESTGEHEWKFWNEYLEVAIIWMLTK